MSAFQNPDSRVSRLLERLAPLGECSPKDLKRIALEMSESKDQADSVVGEAVQRGFIERRVALTPKGAAVHASNCLRKSAA